MSNKWEQIERTASSEVVAALKKLNAYFDGRRIAEWAANLYDPEVGGFYYSNSARDNEGYAPDLESTCQILHLLTGNGGYKSSDDALPDDIKQKIVDFVKSTQSPDDGYFYHPQWPKGRENLNNDRYGRDMGWACALLRELKPYGKQQYPPYCTPMGVKCERHKDTDDSCFPTILPAPKPADPKRAMSQPDYSSHEAFRTWLEDYDKDIKIASGRAHNLAALRNEIVAKGFGDDVIDFYDRIQAELFEEQTAAGLEPTGAWQTDLNYKLIWGVWKHLHYYNYEKCNRPTNLKYAPYMLRSCIKVILQKIETPHAMNDLFNQWVSVSAIISNVRRHYGAEEAERLHEIVREYARELVDITLEKIASFKNDDGTVVYRSVGTGLKSIYGVPIAEGVREGDANGMSLCCSMYNAVFGGLGYPPVRIMDESDGERFIEILKNKEKSFKNA